MAKLFIAVFLILLNSCSASRNPPQQINFTEVVADQGETKFFFEKPAKTHTEVVFSNNITVVSEGRQSFYVSIMYTPEEDYFFRINSYDVHAAKTTPISIDIGCFEEHPDWYGIGIYSVCMYDTMYLFVLHAPLE